MAQPPLSQQIRQLEAELGVTLLTRTTRRVDLTAAGAAYLVRAREILAAVDAAGEEADRVASGSSGRLVVGCVGSATYSLLPALATPAARAAARRRLRLPRRDALARAGRAALQGRLARPRAAASPARPDGSHRDERAARPPARGDAAEHRYAGPQAAPGGGPRRRRTSWSTPGDGRSAMHTPSCRTCSTTPGSSAGSSTRSRRPRRSSRSWLQGSASRWCLSRPPRPGGARCRLRLARRGAGRRARRRAPHRRRQPGARPGARRPVRGGRRVTGGGLGPWTDIATIVVSKV